MAVGYGRDEYWRWRPEKPLETPAQWENPGQGGVDLIGVVAAVFLLFILFRLTADGRGTQIKSLTATKGQTGNEAVRVEATESGAFSKPMASGGGETFNPAMPMREPSAGAPVSPDDIDYPYDVFNLTQGPHGYSYGHAAIDISAGKGATIKSPIAGHVSANTVDIYGNTTLIIENARYQVTLLHGLYDVTVGAQLSLGQAIGEESNQGYTIDFQGRSCRGRDCGYHTHLNVFDKVLGHNVNPLALLSE